MEKGKEQCNVCIFSQCIACQFPKRERERERERETEENPTTVAQVKIHSRVWESLTVCGACAAESKSKH